MNAEEMRMNIALLKEIKEKKKKDNDAVSVKPHPGKEIIEKMYENQKIL